MYLHQKLKYIYKHIETEEELRTVLDINKKMSYIGWDTETTGLNIITDKPFLVSFGWFNEIYTFDYTPSMFNILLDFVRTKGIPMFAHNAKYDYHMVQNGGSPITDDIKIYDSITVARLTEVADERTSMSLESLGTRYVDEEAKFAGHIIKDIIRKLDKEKLNKLREGLMDAFPGDGFSVNTRKGTKRSTGKLSALIENYRKHRTHYVNDDNEYFKFIDANFSRSTYKDVYDVEPLLVRNYAADDIVIMLEYLKKALPVLKQIDINFRVLKREGELIKAVAFMENTGFKVDVNYILESRKRIVDYRDLLYGELVLYTGENFSVGQHEFIKKLFLTKYKIKMEKADEKSLKYVIEHTENDIIKKVCNNIIELRTLDKWLSTYIDGKLNSIVNGRIYTDINNSGAVSGRVSCDMQQQPKYGLNDRDGNELFHPRRAFICDDGYRLFFIDKK